MTYQEALDRIKKLTNKVRNNEDLFTPEQIRIAFTDEADYMGVDFGGVNTSDTTIYIDGQEVGQGIVYTSPPGFTGTETNGFRAWSMNEIRTGRLQR